MNEHFVLFFTRSGDPRLECMEYDPATGSYKPKPIARESERADRALDSPAGRWYSVIRVTRRRVLGILPRNDHSI
jgi:hypothetical protein